MQNFNAVVPNMDLNNRQLQTRQARRIIAPGTAKEETNEADKAEQLQNNYAHLAYQVEKYQDPKDPTVSLNGE